MTQNNSNNPLLAPFDFVPFDRIKPAHFTEAIGLLIEKTKEEVTAIAQQTDQPTFDNTIAALDYTGLTLGVVASTLFNLNSAETNQEIQEITATLAPKLSELNVWIHQHEALFARVAAVYNHPSTLDPESKMLLDKTYQRFIKTGIELPEAQRIQIKDIDAELSTLSVNFEQHVLQDTNEYQLHVTDADKLTGIPSTTLEAASAEAKSKGIEGWVFTLQYPSYIPFMTYCQDRELRKQMALAKGAIGFQNNTANNEQIILKTIQLRQQRAELLGENSHAAYKLKDRMLNTPEKVMAFLQDLHDRCKPFAQKEFETLSDYAYQLDGIKELEKWDIPYYTEKYKQKTIHFNQEQARAYFPLAKVLQGIFDLFETLFELSFEPDATIPVYHKEVTAYKVFKNGVFKAILYVDLFPRAGKRAGAWMTTYKEQYRWNNIHNHPHVSIVCNFTPPTTDHPSLLTPDEVRTLHHELGHAIHSLLSDLTYPSLSGTNVAWDFVELPSQLMENWALEPEFISGVAAHYQTGEALPDDLMHAMQKAVLFIPGLQTLRQLSFGFMDMAWHHNDVMNIQNIKAFEESIMSGMRFYKEVETNCFSTGFAHIFSGGYAAGYYSYKWSEVLDADAFSYFKETNLFDKTIGKKLEEHILSKGGSEPPEVLYERFRGRAAEVQALLDRYQFN